MNDISKNGNRTVIRETLKPVVAQFFDVDPDTIDEIIIITRGECNSCDQRNMITLLDTIADDETFAEVMSNALITRIEGELFLCQGARAIAGGTTGPANRFSLTCVRTRMW